MPNMKRYEPTMEVDRMLSIFGCISSKTGKIKATHKKHMIKLNDVLHMPRVPTGVAKTNDANNHPMTMPMQIKANEPAFL